MSKKLKIIIFFFIILLIIIGSAKMVKMIDYFDLIKEVQIIGRLYKPVGTMLKLEGNIIYGENTNKKGGEAEILLKINSIDGVMQSKIIIIPLKYFSWTNVKKPKDGDFKKYIGYESGELMGIPEKAFKYMPRVATKDYHFGTYFQVCKETK